MSAIPAPLSRPSSRAWLAGTALFLLPLLAYLPALRAGFIWDDDLWVTGNPSLRTLAGLGQIWLLPLQQANGQYYPLSVSSFWLDYHLWGLHPLPYHALNVLLHAASTLLLWRLLRSLQVPGAWLAAAIFAIHPVQAESVAWISERKNVLAGVFYLAALLASLRFSSGAARRRWYALAFGLFLLAMFSKTVAGSFPAVVLLIVYWKRGRLTRRDVLPLLPFFAVSIAMGLLTGWLEVHVVLAAGPEWEFSFPQRILIAGQALWFYAAKLLWPVQLNFMYPKWPVDPHRPLLWLYPIAAAAVIPILWLLRRPIGRGPFVCVSLFAGCLFPALGFANLYPMRYTFAQDHFQYFASIGLIVLFVAAAARLTANRPGALRLLGAGMMMLLVPLTFIRAGVFRSSDTLYQDTLAKNPNAWMAHNNLGLYDLFTLGDTARALREFQTAAAIDAVPAEPRINLARVHMLLGDAESGPNIPTLANPAFYADGWIAIGRARWNQQDLSGAREAFKNAAVRSPESVLAHLNLAAVLDTQGDRDQAIAEWRSVRELAAASPAGKAALSQALAGDPRLSSAADKLAGAPPAP